MRARDIVGRTIVDIRQERVSTRWSGDGVEQESAWAVYSITLDNGKVLHLRARETDTEPIVVAWVR